MIFNKIKINNLIYYYYKNFILNLIFLNLLFIKQDQVNNILIN